MLHSFEALRDVTRLMAPDAALRPLRVRVSRSLASNWLVPRLPELCAAHPEISLILQIGGAPDDLSGGATDVGIFWGVGDWGELETHRLWDFDAFVVCAPSPAGGRRPPRIVAELREHELLDISDPVRVWPDWLNRAGYKGPAPRTRIVFDSLQVMYESAAAGLGLAIGIRPVVDKYLKDVRLVKLFKEKPNLAGAYYLLTTRQTVRFESARILGRWLIGQSTNANELHC